MAKIMERYRGLSTVAKATLWFTICNVFQKCLSVLTTPIFTRLMTTEQYGQVTIFNSWMQILTLICTFRLDYGVLYKGLSKYNSDKDNYVSSMQSFSTVITVIVTVIYLIFRKPINQLTELTTFLSIVMILEVFGTFSISYWSGMARYEYKYKKIICLTFAMSIINVLLSFIAVLLSEHKDVARITISAVVQLIFGLAIYLENLRKSKKIIVKEYVNYAFLFNLPLIPHYLASYILDQSDRIMIQKLIGLSEAAIYGVAYNVAIAIKVISNSINNALVPWEYKKLEERDFKSFNKTFNGFMLLFAAVSIVFIAFAPEAIYILAGKQYAEAVYCIPPVTASCFFTFVWGVYGNAEFYYNANKFTMYISIVGAVLNLILNYIFIPIYGYVAAAYTTLFCYIVFTVLHFAFANYLTKKNVGKYSFDIRSLLIYSVLVVTSSILMSFLYDKILIRYFFIGVLCIIAFALRRKIVMLIKIKEK